jgi:Fuc2NAc and GlcNAc transferase
LVPAVAIAATVGGFVCTLVLLWVILRQSMRLNLQAHPNDRSLHDRPTPTGGGVAFALPVLGYLAWLAWLGAAPALPLLAGGAAIMVVGLWDDVRELPPFVRLAVHAVSALALVASVLSGAGWLVMAVAVLALVWQVNLYNFMDGIDGLVGAQTLFFLLSAHLVALGLPGWTGDLYWLAAGTMIGFLVFNWPPARIFMGDAGSGFLGWLTGATVLVLWQQQALPLPAALVLLSGTWFDATYTLIVRTMTGQALAQAHRSHLYQKLAARRGHRWVTVAFLLYGVGWLLPLSWFCASQSPGLTPGALLWVLPAVTPLAVYAWGTGAGQPMDSADDWNA